MSFIIKGKPKFVYEVRTYRFCSFYEDMKQAIGFAVDMSIYTEVKFTTYEYINSRYEEFLTVTLKKRSDWI